MFPRTENEREVSSKDAETFRRKKRSPEKKRTKEIIGRKEGRLWRRNKKKSCTAITAGCLGVTGVL